MPASSGDTLGLQLRGFEPCHGIQPTQPGDLQLLLAVGKPKKLTFTACMSKMLTILNGMVKSGQRWNPHTMNSWHQRRLLSLIDRVMEDDQRNFIRLERR